MLGPTLLSLHNVAYYCRLMTQTRQAIREGRFAEFCGSALPVWVIHFKMILRNGDGQVQQPRSRGLPRSGVGPPFTAGYLAQFLAPFTGLLVFGFSRQRQQAPRKAP